MELKQLKATDIPERWRQQAARYDKLETKTGMYTAKVDGAYRKQKLKGGNDLIFVDCYQGKKKGVICIFDVPHTKQLGAKQYHLEVPLTDIENTVTGGYKLVELLTGKHDTHVPDTVEAEGYEEHPLFGAFS